MTKDELKAYIAERIRSNHARDITGPRLQDVLDTMVDNLGVVAGFSLPEENFGYGWTNRISITTTYTRAEFLALLGIDGGMLDLLMEGGVQYIDSPYHYSAPRSETRSSDTTTIVDRFILRGYSFADLGTWRDFIYETGNDYFHISRDSDGGYHIGHDRVE